MKKSEMYKVAMMAVVASGSISPNVKVDVVKELISREKMEICLEEIDEEKKEAEKVRITESTIAEVRRFQEEGTEDEKN